MTQHEIICPLDGKKHTSAECYWGDCTNEQYFECFPSEPKLPPDEVAEPMKTFIPKNK